MKILIVDDEELIRSVIKEYCDSNNYETDEATSGKEALEKIDGIKKAILARAFRGELGTNDENDESAVELLKRVL